MLFKESDDLIVTLMDLLGVDFKTLASAIIRNRVDDDLRDYISNNTRDIHRDAIEFLVKLERQVAIELNPYINYLRVKHDAYCSVTCHTNQFFTIVYIEDNLNESSPY